MIRSLATTMKWYLCALVSIAGLAQAGLAEAAVLYKLDSIAAYLGVSDVLNPNARDINESGQVTGDYVPGYESRFAYVTNPDKHHAYMASPNGGVVTNLNPSSGGLVIADEIWGERRFDVSYGLAINSLGQVTGRYTPYDGSFAGVLNHAFMTNSQGKIIGLGTLNGVVGYSFGADINDSGQVTGGSYYDGSGNTHAFITSPSGVMTDLGTLGGQQSQGLGINDSGQVTGASETANGGSFNNRAFVTNSQGQMVDLGAGDGSYGAAINNLGQITGSFLVNGIQHVFVTDSQGQIIDLGTLGSSSPFSGGSDINNLGQVVGVSDGKAFVTDNGVMKDLNTLLFPEITGWQLFSATGINDRGQIVGMGLYNGVSRSFVLTPATVPVPAAVWLFASGLVGLLRFNQKARSARLF